MKKENAPEKQDPKFWFERITQLEADVEERRAQLQTAKGSSAHHMLLTGQVDGELTTHVMRLDVEVSTAEATLMLARQQLAASERCQQAEEAAVLKEEAQGHAATMIDAAKKLVEVITDFAGAYMLMQKAGVELIGSMKKASQMYPPDQRTDGRVIAVPLAWFPRLLHATPEQRAKVEISPMGLHWDELDEDVSVSGLLAGRGDLTASTSATV